MRPRKSAGVVSGIGGLHKESIDSFEEGERMSIELHYRESGPMAPPPQTSNGARTDGPVPLIVLHGLFGSSDNWRSHLRQWGETRRVIAIDLRNHGHSPHRHGMRYKEMAQDVIATLDRLEIETFELLGHSMGGKVAMTLARLHPERVARLIVADIAPIAYEHGHDDIFSAHRLVEDALPESRREADEAMKLELGNPTTRQFLSTNLVRDDQGILGWRVGLDEIEAGYSDIIAAPDGDAPYEGPTLVLRGERSNYVPDESRAAILAIMPAAEIVTLEGAGHWLHAEQPGPFSEAVLAFLDRPS